MAKTFVLSDENLNSYGFRILTGGIDIGQFKKNPIMLFMHNRPFRGTTDEYTVIGKWDNIRKEGTQLLADAVFDETDPFAKMIADKVENGFLRMASIGAKPVETSNDPRYLLPGQVYETVTKSKAREASIVDLGGNDNALALSDNPALYDMNEVLIELTSGNIPPLPLLLKHNENIMEIKLIDFAKEIGLGENASGSDILLAIKNLTADKRKQKIELTAVKLAQKSADIKTLVDGARDAKKITAEQHADFVTLAEANYETAKKILDGMKPYEAIETELSDRKSSDPELDGLLKLSGEELWRQGKLETLKKKDFASFKLKYKEHYNTEYTGAQ